MSVPAMSILEQLRTLSSAEDFFACLDVAYDPQVVNVARLHILRRMGHYLATQDLAALPDDAARDLVRAQLRQAYEDFVASSPLQQRVFKVLKDAVKPAPASRPPALVSLAPLSSPLPQSSPSSMGASQMTAGE